MNLINKINISLLVTIGLAGMTACSHGPSTQEFPDTASPKDEVAKLDSDVRAAAANQMAVLAPNNFKETENALVNAKRSLDKQKDAEDTLHHVAQGRAYLNRSNEFAKFSHANIEDVVVARQQAITSGAPELFSEDFVATDANLMEVTSDIEENELEAATESRSKLQLAYLDLELRAIKRGNLGKARETIALAVKEGANEFAPRSLALAEKSVQDTDAFITANRHETAPLALRSAETLAASEHLLKIARDSKSGNKTTSEDLALQMESETNKTAAKQAQLDTKQLQLAAGETANQALIAKNSNLESEKAMDLRYEVARSEFSAGEAEVYKQGNTLMIRLRGLEFPTSQAMLRGSNFPLLAKVQKVIKDFGSGSVVVEGHTDSNGGKSLNEKLSSQRAEAVKEYLSSNMGDVPVSVTAVGYGYQKPLSTNKTITGRAQNRRVDILIQPKS